MGSATLQGKMVSLLRALGADYVLDTQLCGGLNDPWRGGQRADQAGHQGNAPAPVLYCPAWGEIAEIYYRTCWTTSQRKEPHRHAGPPPSKTYFAKKMGLDPRTIM